MSDIDARPFDDLYKSAEKFKEIFDDDIRKCAAFLDAKITTLICDPDSLDNPSKGIYSNTLAEFANAKYEIFVGVKSLMSDMEREWMKYISEMKKLFIENVEIFLANTKLEVKLPHESLPKSRFTSHRLERALVGEETKSFSKESRFMAHKPQGFTSHRLERALVGEDTESFSKARVTSLFSNRDRPSISSIKLPSNQSSSTNVVASNTDSSSSDEEPAEVKSQFNRSRPPASPVKQLSNQTEVKSQFNRSRPSASSIKLSSNKSLNINVIATNSDSSDTDEEPEYDNFAPQSTPVGRRKTTMAVDIEKTVPDFDIDVAINRPRGKRKTIGSVSELTSTVPSKRLKARDSIRETSSQDEDIADNLLESGNYSNWTPLINISAKVPAQPGVYEVKVWRAKKTAFIGSCENLLQKLTLHKLRQNSGHKHLDKFLERNMNDIQIRYEVMPSVNEAEAAVKNRIQSFVAQHKTTPAYN